MVYGDGLENRCRCKPTVGSNPTPSAILKLETNNNRKAKAPIFRGLFHFANKTFVRWFDVTMITVCSRFLIVSG